MSDLLFIQLYESRCEGRRLRPEQIERIKSRCRKLYKISEGDEVYLCMFSYDGEEEAMVVRIVGNYIYVA